MTSEATHIQPSARHDPSVILDVEQLSKRFPIARGLVLRRDVGAVQAVRDASFRVRRGATLGLVGESGSGKSTTARCILRLIDPTSGRVWFRPNPNDAPVDVASAGRQQLQRVRREMQVVFQDPYASLDPKMRVEAIVAEPLAVHGIGSRHDRRDRVRELLEVVGLQRGHAERFPHEFSGGQRQRIGIARALALNPSLIVLDEPVSSLDVSIQAQVINLLLDLQARFGLSYLFIAHDLSVVRRISSEIAVMYLGRIVEMGECDAIFREPLHPYTHALLSAVPVPDPDVERARRRIVIRGDLPSPSEPPSGCTFHPRCPLAGLPEPCATDGPDLVEVRPGHWVACHFPGDPRTIRQVSTPARRSAGG